MGTLALQQYTPNVRKLNALYATLPRIECRRLCAECCGPISSTRVERMRLSSVVGDLGTEKVRGLTVLVDPLSGMCPALDTADGTCRAYAVRPMICRLWGLVRRMSCPHECEPSRWLTDVEADWYLREAERIGGGM